MIFIYIIKHPPPKRTYPTNIHPTKNKRTFHRKQPTMPRIPEGASTQPFRPCPPSSSMPKSPSQRPKPPEKPSFLPLTVFNNRHLPPNYPTSFI